jgi:hypothetical protein
MSEGLHFKTNLRWYLFITANRNGWFILSQNVLVHHKIHETIIAGGKVIAMCLT